MGAVAAAPIIGTLIGTAISTAGTLIEMNQQKKQAEGAANAADQERRDLQKKNDDQKKMDKANLNQQGDRASASQKAALDAIRASMSASAGSGGAILSGPSGAAAAPTASKSLLGV